MKIRDMFYKGIDREINGVSGSPVSLEVVNLIF